MIGSRRIALYLRKEDGIMDKNVFEYLDKKYRYLNNYIQYINKCLLIEPKRAIEYGRNYVENLTQEIAKLEGYGLLNSMTQFERLRKLEDEGVLKSNIKKSFHMIRTLEIKAAFSDVKGQIEAALNINRNIHTITSWFVKSYIYPKYVILSYNNPMLQKGKVYAIDQDDIIEIMAKQHNGSITEKNQLKDEVKQNKNDKESDSTESFLDGIFN